MNNNLPTLEQLDAWFDVMDKFYNVDIRSIVAKAECDIQKVMKGDKAMSTKSKEETKTLQAEIEELKVELSKKDKEITALKEGIEQEKYRGYFLRRETVLKRAMGLFVDRRGEIMKAIADLSRVHVILYGDGDYYYPRLENGILEIRYNNNDLMDVPVVSHLLDVFEDTVEGVVNEMHMKLVEALEKCRKNSDFADYPINNSFSG